MDAEGGGGGPFRRPTLRNALDEDPEVAAAKEAIMMGGAPSAKFTRIKRPGGGGPATDAAAAAPEPSPPSPPPPPPPPPPPAVVPTPQSVMGEVVERPRRAAAPQPPAPPSAPFPVATHRRQSKFALGRQQQQQRSGGGGGGLSAAAATRPAPQANNDNPAVPEARGAAAENAARLAGMSAEEREEALEEVRGRLPASAIEFLRRRGQQRATAGAGAATAGAGAAAAAPPLRPPRPQPPQQPQASTASSSSLPPAARVRFSLSDGAPVGVLPAAAAADNNSDAATTTTTTTTPESALERDPLRFGPDAEGLGYTCNELAALSRSAHAPQRQAALRGLAAVLRRARPRVGDARPPSSSSSSSSVAQPPCRPVFSDAPPSSSAAASWSDVWDYLVVVVRVAVPLRAALDDAHGGAAAAAAEALAALLAPSPQEALALEACSDGGGSGGVGGLPAPWSSATLRRAGPDAPWETAADLAAVAEAAAQAAAEHKSQQQQKKPEDEDEEGPPPAPEDIAAVDPMCGFLATDPLPRVRFLLAQAAAGGHNDGGGGDDNPAARAAAPHLLAVLAAATRSSPQAALAVARCPGLLPAVVALLQPQQQQPDSSGGGGGGGNGNGAPSSAPPPPPTRLAAMALARALCQASAATAHLARSAGLLAQAQLALAGEQQQEAVAGRAHAPPPPLLLLRLEALRAWRAAALHGVLDPGMHLDVMYANGGLCELLAPPPADDDDEEEEEDENGQGGPTSTATALAWRLRGEAFSVAAALVAHAQATSTLADAAPPGLSPGCAAALAEGAAADWLCNDVLRRVQAAWLSSASASPSPSSLAWGAHPALALPRAAAPAAALAAAVQYLAVYWRSVGGPPRGDVRDALVGRLMGVGLLLPEDDVDGGGTIVGAALLHRCAKEGLDAVRLACRRADDDVDDPDGTRLLQAHAEAAPALALVSAAAALAAAVGELGSARSLARRALFGSGGGLCDDALSLAERWSRRAPCVMEPWRLMRHLLWQPRLRLLTELARLLLVVPKGGDDNNSGGAADGDEAELLANALLAVPALALPGAEADAMEALSLALCPKCLARPLERAQEALDALDASAGATGQDAASSSLRPAALAAQGAARWWVADGDRKVRYPLPSPFPSPQALSEVLTQGYAAAWLSMVPQQALEAGGGSTGDASAANAAAIATPLRRPMLDEGTGSRLPLPAHWVLTEILAAPAASKPATTAATTTAPHPAGAALLWVLGLDCAAGAYLARAVPHPPTRVQGVLRLAYLFNTQELVSMGGGGGGGKPPTATATAGAGAALEAPLVRWPLAALVARWTQSAVDDWSSGTTPSSTPTLWTDVLFVQRLAEMAGTMWAGGDLAAASHAALALSPALAAPGARAAAWRALADSEALERLPPAVACPGRARAFCCPLGEGCRCLDDDDGQEESGESSDDARALSSLYFPWPAREFSNACAQSLALGKLAKSQALGGLTYACALHAVAARALADDAAWGAGGSGGGGGEANDAATNVLRGVLRAAPPGRAKVLVRCAARCGGIGMREATRRAVVACHGDGQLMAVLARDGLV